MSPQGTNALQKLHFSLHKKAGTSRAWTYLTRPQHSMLSVKLCAYLIPSSALFALAFHQLKVESWWIIFAAWILRFLGGYAHSDECSGGIHVSEFSPFEVNRQSREGWKSALPWQFLLLLEGYALTQFTGLISNTFLQIIFALTYGTSFLYIAHRATRCDIPEPIKDIRLLENFGENPKWVQVLDSWLNDSLSFKPIDRLYLYSLRPGEKIAARLLLNEKHTTASKRMPLGMAMMLAPSAIIAARFSWEPATRMIGAIEGPIFWCILFVCWICGVLFTTSIGGKGGIGIAAPVSYSEVLSAYMKLAFARWFMGWIPATIISLILFWNFTPRILFDLTFLLPLFLILAAPGIIAIAATFRVGGFGDFTGSPWKRWTLFAFGIAVPLYSFFIPYLATLRRVMGWIKGTEESPWIALSMALIGSALGILYLVFHRIGWKRGWYDV